MEKLIIKITWQDSATFKEWYNYEELDFIDKTPIINSIGYLIKEGLDYYLIAGNYDDTSCSALTYIPKRCIINKIYLKK